MDFTLSEKQTRWRDRVAAFRAEHVYPPQHLLGVQPLVSVETDKAAVEVPSPRSGRIAQLFGAKGDLMKLGAPLVEFAEGPEEDTGTVVGELDPGKRTQEKSAPRPGEPTQVRPVQILPAVRALARKARR
jgi:2-oxoisovalerate dehydrogenase E2 component (dihydrolipoyl transacylase)